MVSIGLIMGSCTRKYNKPTAKEDNMSGITESLSMPKIDTAIKKLRDISTLYYGTWDGIERGTVLTSERPFFFVVCHPDDVKDLRARMPNFILKELNR